MCSTSDCKDSKNATCLSTGTTERSTSAGTGTRKPVTKQDLLGVIARFKAGYKTPLNASDCFCVLNAQMLSDVKALSAFTSIALQDGQALLFRPDRLAEYPDYRQSSSLTAEDFPAKRNVNNY